MKMKDWFEAWDNVNAAQKGVEKRREVLRNYVDPTELKVSKECTIRFGQYGMKIYTGPAHGNSLLTSLDANQLTVLEQMINDWFDYRVWLNDKQGESNENDD